MKTAGFSLLTHALGWTLLHFCWQGALVAVLLACVLSLMNTCKPQKRYIACCLALLVMAVLPFVTYVRIVSAAHPATAMVVPSWSQNSGVRLQVGSLPSQPSLDRFLQAWDQSLPLVLMLWCAGVLFALIRLGTGLTIAHRMRSTGIQPVPPELQVIFDKLVRRAALTRSAKLLASALVEVPTVIGWLRPLVLLPLSCLTGLSDTQLEAILAHELAHIRRHDYLFNVLQSVVEALLFYHPAVWWVSKKIRTERENCCDDIAIAIAGDALGYAKALALLEECRSNVPQPILKATGGLLVMRIRRIIGMEEAPAESRIAALVVLTVILTSAGVGVSAVARAQPKIALQDSTLSQSHNGGSALRGEYQRWLDQDVRWNITPAERTVFLHLSSDAERDNFIQQFWTRRDAPGAPRNSARSEHYQRLAYANQHFAASRPGWETDRGRIYILYGAPTSIDAHPTGSGSDNPYEVWDYDNALELGQHVELRFVDACKCGDYELMPESEAKTTSSGQLDQVLYAKGLAQMEQGKYEVARLSLQTLLNEYPSSAFAESAQLAIAASWDQQGDAAAIQQANQAYADADVLPQKVGGRVSAPVLTFQAEPEYSELARAAKEQGDVLINFWVDDQGRPSHVRVARSLAKDLDEKAVEAVRKYRFKPAMLDGAPVLVAMNVEVNFKIF